MNKNNSNRIPFSNDPKLHDKIGNSQTDINKLAKRSYEDAVEFMEFNI